MVHYLGTGKSIDGQAREQLPFRAYFASCARETANPRVFVSLTLADTGPALIVVNGGNKLRQLVLPDPDPGHVWDCVLDTAAPQIYSFFSRTTTFSPASSKIAEAKSAQLQSGAPLKCQIPLA